MNALRIIQGIVLQKFAKTMQSERTDVLMMMSENDVRLQTDLHVHQYVTFDGNIITQTDAYGMTTGTDLAHIQDRVWLEHSYTLPTARKIGLVIDENNAVTYGIDLDDFSDRTATGAQAIALTNAIGTEIDKMVTDVMQARRTQVKNMIIDFSNPASPAHQRPMNLTVVDFAINRPLLWSYTNRITGLLTETTKALAVDIMAGEEVDAFGNYTGVDEVRVILHASSYSTAEKVHLSADYIPVYTAGMSFTKNKYVGVYSDLANRDNWVWFTPMAKIVRRGRKYGKKQLPNGIRVRVFISGSDAVHPTSGLPIGEGSLVIVVKDDTIMCVDDINGIGMSIN